MNFIRSLYQMSFDDRDGTGLKISEETMRSKISDSLYEEIVAEIKDKGSYVFPGLSNDVLKGIIKDTELSIQELSVETGLSESQLNDMYDQYKVISYHDVIKLLKIMDIDPVLFLM